jgi:hypothetical protein
METVSVQLCTESDFTERRDLTQKTSQSSQIELHVMGVLYCDLFTKGFR